MTPQGRACPGFANRARQRGAVALTVGLVLLILATGGTFYVTRTSMIDQRIAADAIRARSAFEAAEAGMNFAIAFMDVDKRDLDGNSTDDRIQMLINLALTDASGPGGVDDMDDGYGREFDDCDTNGDGRCDKQATTPEIGGNGYRLQATWDSGNGDWSWSFPSQADGCDSSTGAQNVRICLLLKMKVNDDPHDSSDKTVESRVEVASTGYSEDRSAITTITQDMRRVPGVLGSMNASHALVAYGGVGVSGSMSIVNAFSNATIWCGTDVTNFGGTNSGTFIHPDPDGPTSYSDVNGDLVPFFDSDNDKQYDSGEPLLLNYSANANSSTWSRPDFTNASKGGGSTAPILGVDVIDNSSDLRCNKNPATNPPGNPDCFFENFIGTPPLYAKEAADYVTTNSNLADPSGSYEIPGSYIWVDKRNSDGTLSEFSLSNSTYGSPEKPILLIIDADFNPRASSRVYGVVFVRGDVVGGGSGGGLVIGSLIVEGNVGVTGAGGLDVIYDPNVIDRAGSGDARNSVAPISGTWKDWQ